MSWPVAGHNFTASPPAISFCRTGNDDRLVVTVSTLAGMTIGSSVGMMGPATSSAYATSADGAIVDSSMTYYAFAAGRACGIPTQSALMQIPNADRASRLTGSVTVAQTNARPADGVLFDGVVNRGVYLSSNDNLFQFMTTRQLMAAGYGGTAAVSVPSTCGLPVVVDYTSP